MVFCLLQGSIGFFDTALERFGLAVVFLGFVCWFVIKRLWPFIEARFKDDVRRIDELSKRNDSQAKAFTDQLSAESELRHKMLEAIEHQTSTLEALKNEVRTGLALREDQVGLVVTSRRVIKPAAKKKLGK